MKVSIGLTFDSNELDMISVPSEIPRIRMMNDPITSNMKIELLRKCAKRQIFLLFPKPILVVVAQDPDFYRDGLVNIALRIPRGHSDFFVFQYPQSAETVIAKGRDSIPKNFHRTYLADLIFDYLNILGTHANKNTPDEGQSLDIYEILDKLEDLKKYLDIDTVPPPENAGRSLEDIPELESVYRPYFVENNAQFRYRNPTFLPPVRLDYIL